LETQKSHRQAFQGWSHHRAESFFSRHFRCRPLLFICNNLITLSGIITLSKWPMTSLHRECCELQMECALVVSHRIFILSHPAPGIVALIRLSLLNAQAPSSLAWDFGMHQRQHRPRAPRPSTALSSRRQKHGHKNACILERRRS
jgi:hypothetical protein